MLDGIFLGGTAVNGGNSRRAPVDESTLEFQAGGEGRLLVAFDALSAQIVFQSTGDSERAIGGEGVSDIVFQSSAAGVIWKEGSGVSQIVLQSTGDGIVTEPNAGISNIIFETEIEESVSPAKFGEGTSVIQFDQVIYEEVINGIPLPDPSPDDPGDVIEFATVADGNLWFAVPPGSPDMDIVFQSEAEGRLLNFVYAEGEAQIELYTRTTYDIWQEIHIEDQPELQIVFEAVTDVGIPPIPDIYAPSPRLLVVCPDPDEVEVCEQSREVCNDCCV